MKAGRNHRQLLEELEARELLGRGGHGGELRPAGGADVCRSHRKA